MLPPVSKLVTSDAPFGKATIPCIIDVNVGPKSVAINNANTITIVAESTEWTIFPLRLGTIKAAKNGIVAKSPNGNTRLPGKIMAKNNVIGTINSPVAKVAGDPVERAASIPK